MKMYLHDFLKRFSYPADACAALETAFEKINSSAFDVLIQHYAEDRKCDFAKLVDNMKKLSEEGDIHEYTGNLLLMIGLSRTLRQYYEAEKIEERIWFDSMCDLQYKMDECKCVYGIWGTFVPYWFDRFFQMERFALGRLQFEIVPFGQYYENKGIVLTPDTIVLNTHIPRTGTKLSRELVKDSYAQAADFFKSYFQLNRTVFICGSWLLFPRHKEVLSVQSNIYAFISDFELYKEGYYDDYSQVWRLFDKMYTGAVEELPQDTALRRIYAEWIRRGERTGWGNGVYIYEQ